MFLISWPNGLIFLKFHSLFKIMSPFRLLHIQTSIFLFTFPGVSINLLFSSFKYILNISLKSFSWLTVLSIVLTSVFSRGFSLGIAPFSFNPCRLLCCSAVILGLYSIPELLPLFSQSHVSPRYGLYPHFAGVHALVSSSEVEVTFRSPCLLTFTFT